MIMSSMSVCFGTLAAPTGVSDAEWNTLIAALKAEAVSTATFTGSAGAYTVQDTDGSILAAVNAYWTVFDKQADKSPSSKDSGNRVIQQVNDTIKSQLSTKMGTAYTTAIDNFVGNMKAGSTVSTAEGDQQQGKSSWGNVSYPDSNLPTINDIKITVKGADITKFNSVDEMPTKIYSDKTFTVSHANDLRRTWTSGGFISRKYYCAYAYYIESTSASGGAEKYDTTALKAAYADLANYSSYFVEGTTDNIRMFAALGEETLGNDKIALENIKTTALAYGEGTWTKYFPVASYNLGVSNIEQALEVLSYQAVIDKIEVLIDVDYADYTLAEKKAHYSELDTALDAYHGLSTAVKEILAYDTADADAYSAVLKRDIELTELRELKAIVDGKYNTYRTYFLADIPAEEINTGDLGNAIIDLNAQIDLINQYDAANVLEVFGDDYITKIQDEVTRLSELKDISEHYDRYMERYDAWIGGINEAIASTDEATLYNALASYDTWYAELKALVAEIEADFGDTVADTLMQFGEEAIFAAMDNAYVRLGGIVKGQVDTAYAVYENLKETVGTLTFVNLGNYQAAKNSLGLINSNAYNFLAGDNEGKFEHDAETVRKYNELKNLIAGLDTFEATKGLEGYTQREVEYADRPLYSTDLVKTEGYEVTEENLLSVIELLDGFLTSETFEGLIGGSIEDMLVPMLEDLIFTDSLINTLVNVLYPLVQATIAGVLYDNAYTKIDGIEIFGYKLGRNLLEFGNTQIFETVGLYIYPHSLAKLLGDYPQAQAALNATPAYNDPYATTTEEEELMWKDSNIWDGEKLTLVWGVDDVVDDPATKVNEKAEAFYKAFGAAMSGLEPLLSALLCDKAIPETHINDIVSLLGNTLDIYLSSTSCSGYADFLVPIFEALGVDSNVIRSNSDMYGYVTTLGKADAMSNVAKAIFEPVFNLVGKVCSAPLDTILNILPNLVYALESDMVMPLLNKLAASIKYRTAPDGLILGNISAVKIDDKYDLTIGDLLLGEADPNAPVKNEDGSLNIAGLLNNLSLETIFELIGISLPALDSETIAYAATRDTIPTKRVNHIYSTQYIGSGNAYHLVADKADLLYYILTYVLEIVGDEAALTGLLEALITTENEAGEKVPDEAKIADAMEIINMLGLDTPGDVIAALVELLNMEKHGGLKNYNWYEGVLGGDVEGYTPALQVYMSTNNDWTHAKAETLVEDLTAVIEGILEVAGSDIKIDAKFKELLGGAFTNATLTELAKTLSGLKLEAPLDSIINDVVGLDLSAFAAYADLAEDYNWGFEDGDVKGFMNALAGLIAPFGIAIDLLFNDVPLTLNLSADDKVSIPGNNGYDTALVPLLEALGCTPAADPENTLTEVLSCVAGVLENLMNAPIDTILNILPGLLYYLSSNALSTGVFNLLQPVYALLDVVRPIYDTDLIGLITTIVDAIQKKDAPAQGEEAAEEKFDILGFISTLNLDDLGVGFVLDLLSDLVLDGVNLDKLEIVIYDVCKIIGKQYDTVSTFAAGAKRGEYTEGTFDKADMLTVILCVVIDILKQGDNAEKLNAKFGTDILTKLLVVFEGTETTEEKINWLYALANEDLTQYDFSSGVDFLPTMSYLDYPTNWNRDTAKYVDANLSTIVNDVVALIDPNYASLKDLIDANLTIYTTENVQAIVDLLAGFLGDINAELLAGAGLLLDADINKLLDYTAPEGIDTGDEFAAALADVLATIPGVVNWLLFGKDYELLMSDTGEAAITIYGAEGYNKGLVPLLEALGVTLPETPDVEAVLKAVFARLDAILANPIDEAFDMLPNLLYFINAGGISASVNNLLSAVNALLTTLKASFGLELDIYGIVYDAIGLDLSDVSAQALIALAEEKLGLELTPAAAVLDGFFLGKLTMYQSANGEYAYRLTYGEEVGEDFAALARYDMLTILVTCLLETVKVEANAEPLRGLLGDAAYETIMNFFGMPRIAPQDFSWIETDKADTNYVFSAISSSELYEGHKYGPHYTKEMEQYIANNIGEFIDNLLYLLGIQINGQNVNTLEDLLNGLVGGSLYSSEVANSLVEALRGVTDSLEGIGDGVGTYIVSILKTSLGVDLSKYDTMEFAAFDNDRAKFEAALETIVEPLFPLLKWLLGNEDFTFFADSKGEVIITLNGAEGYAYGIIPLLEVLDCKNIIASADYYDMVKADESVLITSILKPLLDRVDVILNNPAEEILSMLPNIIYFINSNGVDTVVKNTLSAVYAVLNAIAPIQEINLYEIIGLDLSTLTFEKLFDMLLDMIAESTGYEFESLDANAVNELSVGKLVSYKSANGKTAYKMVYQSEAAKGEMVTVVMRLIVTFIMHENNQEMLLGLLRDNLGMTAEAEKYVAGVLKVLADSSTETQLGMDSALATLYYIYYGLDLGVGELTEGKKNLDAEWTKLLEEMRNSKDGGEALAGEILSGILDIDILEDIIDPIEGIAPNGFIKFFQQIAEWFNAIIEFFKNLFN